jgi:hypothetical protein
MSSSQSPEPFINPYAVSSSAQLLGDPGRGFDDSIFQKGDLLIFHKTAHLPDFCLKSNAPTESRLKRKLTWHHPMIFLLVLLSPLIYIVVALIVSKKATIQIPLDQRFKRKRIRNMLIAWGIVFSSVGSLILAGIVEPQNKGLSVGFILLFPILLLVGALVGLYGCRVVYPKRIDNQFVFLKGTCAEFRSRFPEWPNP